MLETLAGVSQQCQRHDIPFLHILILLRDESMAVSTHCVGYT